MSTRMPTEARREAIVAAALRLLGEKSLDTVTTRDIAAELGVTQPGLFRHFPSREALLLAVVDEVRTALSRVGMEALARPGDAVTRLLALGKGLLAHVEANPGVPRLLFVSVGEPGPVRDALRGLVTAQGGVVAALVRGGQADGSLEPAVDPDAAAQVLVGALQGLVLRWDAEGRPPGLPPRFPPLFAVWVRGLRGAGALPARGAVAGPATVAGWLAYLDAAPLLARREDPLGAVLAALREVPPGGLLLVRAPFRPAPLVALLGGLGHAVGLAELGEEGWLLRVGVGGPVAMEDLRELEPPEPLERALRAAVERPVGEPWFAHLPRVPRLLLPHLEARGVRHAEQQLPDGSAVLVLVRS